MTAPTSRGPICRPPIERAATLRAFAAKIIGYADYFENVRAKSTAPDATEEDREADRVACAEFLSEPGAHAMQQRIEFEAELFEAIEQLKARVRQADRLRTCKTITRDGADPLYARLEQLIGTITSAKL